MSISVISTKTKIVSFDPLQKGTIEVLVKPNKGYSFSKAGGQVRIYKLESNEANRQKLQAYKSLSALVKYAKAHHISDELKSDTPCPVPAPAPAKSAAKGQGILFIDVKSTGRAKDDEIVEIAIVNREEKVLFHSLVKPSKAIPFEAFTKHNINNSDVANALTFAQVWGQINLIVKGHKVIVFNRPLFARMMVQTCKQAFQATDQRLEFRELFPSIELLCLQQDYCNYAPFYSPNGCLMRETLNSACSNQRIYTADQPVHRAKGDAIKMVRLHSFLEQRRSVA